VTGTPAPVVVLATLDPSVPRASLLHLRRIKRAAPQLRVGIAFLGAPPEPARLDEATAIGADFAVTSTEAARTEAFREMAPAPLAPAARRRPRARAFALPA
jgi:hypothetical protein